MKVASAVVLFIALGLLGGIASAARLRQPALHPLQFHPTGTILYVAGYTVDPTTGVTGECNYKRTHSGSGRGGGYKTVTDYYQGVCTWDLFGNLVSQSFTVTSGAPVPDPPPPIVVIGDRTVYGTDTSGDSTGQSSTTTGFVVHSTADYAWAPAAPIATDTATPVTFQATLTSTGDLSLVIDGASAYSSLGQSVTVLDDGCTGQTLGYGQTCTITLQYDAAGLSDSDATTLLDAVYIDVTSNAGISHSYSQLISVTVLND